MAQFLLRSNSCGNNFFFFFCLLQCGALTRTQYFSFKWSWPHLTLFSPRPLLQLPAGACGRDGEHGDLPGQLRLPPQRLPRRPQPPLCTQPSPGQVEQQGQQPRYQSPLACDQFPNSYITLPFLCAVQCSALQCCAVVYSAVHCSVVQCSVDCTLSIIHCIMYVVQCTFYSVHCTAMCSKTVARNPF